MAHSKRWIFALLAASGGKSLLGILSYLANPETTLPSPQLLGRANAHFLPPEISLIHLLAFSAVGCLLLLNSKQDTPIFYLGGFFLTLGSAWANGLLSDLAVFETSTLTHFLAFLSDLPLEAMAAFFAWSFVRDFPKIHLSFEAQRFFRLAPSIAVVIVGSLLGMTSLLAILRYFFHFSVERLLLIVRTSAISAALILIIVTFLCLIQKSRRTEGPERRRLGFFIGSVAIFSLPFCLDISGEILIPPYREGLRDYFLARTLIGSALLLVMPFAAAYAILAQRLIDARLVARKALHYLLARWTSRILLLAPLLLLTLFLYRHRHQTLAEMLSGWTVSPLLILVLLAIAGATYREQILEGVDRRFFRERYNARRILSQLVYQIRSSRDLEELANLVCRGVDLAFHLESAALLVADPHLGQLADPRNAVRPLDLGSQLATWIHGQKDALETDLEFPDSALENLPIEDRHWLVDGRIRTLVPIFTADGSLLAVLALGPKKSQMPFLAEDYQLLTAIASSAALAIELLRLKSQPEPLFEKRPASESIARSPSSDIEEQATECLACDRVFKNDVRRCPRCKIAIENAPIPYVLRNIFRFEERIGTGGMAVVYRAIDLKLGRTVAIKTLPRVSPKAAIRLRKEARTAATVSHFGLAAVHGLETWRGTPMLILELLEGGTLAERLNDEGPLTPLEVIQTGQTVALAIERIHSVGILHRDIKPSNIGFTNDGAAKLLDFGIARIHRDLRRDRALQPLSEDSLAFDTDSWQEVRTASGRVAGTLPYLSPEAVQGDDADPLLDLWSLSVVLYEALAGENLFAGQRLGLMQLLEQIRTAKLPDIASRVPDSPQPLIEFFRTALHAEKSRRPQSGRELHDLLTDVRRAIER